MTFLNKKEDVIKIELTPYGRKMLGEGNFKPIYYTFLDDDILYDSEKAGFTEMSVFAKDRILNETIYMAPQTNYKGVETSIDIKASLRKNQNDDKVIPERSEKLQYQLGTNNYNTNKSAEISSIFLLGEISGSVATQYTGSLNPKTNPAKDIAMLDIPQINCELEYKLSIANRNEPKTDQYGLIPEEFSSTSFKSDGSYIHIDKGEIMILFSEDGGFSEKNNFCLEVFELADDGDLIPLKFEKKTPNIIDDILYDNLQPISTLEETGEETEDKVLYHMQILVDDEISTDKICLGTKILKQNNIYVDIEVECSDKRDGFEVDLYQTTVVDDDLEEC